MFGIWGLKSELLGMLERAVIRYSSFISWKITESYQFFGISRVRRLHLAYSVDLKSWRFFGGSIDTPENS
jgi:hypothetical protein